MYFRLLLVVLLLASCTDHSSAGPPIPKPVVGTPIPPSPTPCLYSDAAKTEAVRLLGAATYERQHGNLSAAQDLARQSLASWPDYLDAKTFLGEVIPLVAATATAGALSGQAKPVGLPIVSASPRATCGTAALPAGLPVGGAATAAPLAAQSQTQSRAIPGLTGDAVQKMLKPLNLSCTRTAGMREMWTCQSATSSLQRIVTYSGVSPTQIQSIKGELVQYTSTPSDVVTLEFLSTVAMLPYKGADPSQARLWIAGQLPNAPNRIGVHAETTISGARFQILGPAIARALTIEGASTP